MTEQMKPSGIAWIGNIPQSWKTSRLKYNITCLDERRIPVDAALRNPGPYAYWGAGSIVDYVDNYIFDEELVLLGEDGAPFFDEYRPVAFLITEKIWANNHIHVIKGKPGVCNRFLVHYLNSVQYQEYINGSVLNKLTQGNMNEIVCPIPSTAEQESIADFLDDKCAKIDGIIADIEKQIETLQKYKKSLITETVTKGLDKSVPMKDSGIEWIGEIPSGWKVEPIKYRVDFFNGDRGENYPSKAEMLTDGVPFINAGHLLNGGLDMENMDFISEEKYRVMGGVKLQENDILYCLRGSVGKNSILSINRGTVASSLVALRSKNISAKFLYYSLNSNIDEVQRFLWDNGTAQPNLSAENLGKFKICVPPYNEQKAIVDFLDSKCANVDTILNQKEKALTLLQQHKKSLIYEYVTGKKRVTEVN